MSASTQTPKRSPGSVTWARRRNAVAQFWREFVQHRAGLTGLIFLIAIGLIAALAPIIAPSHLLDVTQLLDQPKFAPPSLEHPLGTDHQGRQLWVRMVWGAQVSLMVGVAATLMSMLIGTLVGIAAGHFTGWVGGLLMRIIDFFLVLPSLILAIVLSAVLSRGVLTIIIAIGVTSRARARAM